MKDKIEEKLKRFNELQSLVSDPKIINNPSEYKKCAKELSAVQKIVSAYNEYKRACEEAESARLVLEEPHDTEFLDLAREELSTYEGKKIALSRRLEDLLIGESEDFNRDIIMEIRQGTGGAEAALFAQDLFRMYSRYAAKNNWKMEVISSSVTEKGGFKEVIFSITGDGVYGKLRFEIGTHRVQRVPATEASGRIHTSAATVAVFPEAEEVEFEIKPQDLKIDVFRAGGAGGQHVNVTDSAVRITHLPSGLVVSCQDERSQYKNKTKAMRVLRARLLDKMKQEQEKKRSENRRVQVGTGDRSEKIRTYNFPDRRVTDHRIGFTAHNLEEVLNGELDDVLEALSAADRKARMK